MRHSRTRKHELEHQTITSTQTSHVFKGLGAVDFLLFGSLVSRRGARPSASPWRVWRSRHSSQMEERASAQEEPERCWTSSSETLRCRTEPDDKGELRSRCERVRETLRHCAGRADEVLECKRDSFDEPVRSGGTGTLAGTLLSAVDSLREAVRVAERLEKALRAELERPK